MSKKLLFSIMFAGCVALLDISAATAADYTYVGGGRTSCSGANCEVFDARKQRQDFQDARRAEREAKERDYEARQDRKDRMRSNPR